MSTTTEQAAKLRAMLEADILKMLQTFQEVTGLTPVTVDIDCLQDMRRQHKLCAVRVTVEL